jgi:nucleolar complex protein 3
LPAALEGISHFAHFINVDFFRDLLAVLRRIVMDQYEDNEEEHPEAILDPVGASQLVRLRLLAIVTAFDLLSGQGESLNIDLSDFVAQLFALLRPLSLDSGVEDPPLASRATPAPSQSRHKAAVHLEPTSSLLFRCLQHVFFSKYFTSPPYRAGAFAKRLLEAALLFPPATASRSVQFVRQLVARYPTLEGMLNTEERMADGVYKCEMEDPQLVNPFATSFYEVEMFSRHWDPATRREGKKLGDGNTIVQ